MTILINLYAGSIGVSGYSGDGGQALSALLRDPQQCCHYNNHLYFADSGNYVVRKVNIATGVITTVAGTGLWGFQEPGEGVPATTVNLGDFSGICVDSSGNIFIGDYGAAIIRRVDGITGIMNRFAGTLGSFGFSGDGGQALSAQLGSFYQALTVDSSDNVYLADYNARRIRKITVATGIIDTVAGNGTSSPQNDGGPATSAAIGYPEGLCIDKQSGDLLISCTSIHRVKRVNQATQIINTIAGTGAATHSGDGGLAVSAGLPGPRAITTDTLGGICVFQNGAPFIPAQRIRQIITSGFIDTIAGTGSDGHTGDGGDALLADISGGYGMDSDDLGNLYLTTWGFHTIRVLTLPPVIFDNFPPAVYGIDFPDFVDLVDGVLIDTTPPVKLGIGSRDIADSQYDQIQPAGIGLYAEISEAIADQIQPARLGVSFPPLAERSFLSRELILKSQRIFEVELQAPVDPGTYEYLPPYYERTFIPPEPPEITNVKIPCSSLTISARTDGPSSVTASIPGISRYTEQITERLNGFMFIRAGYVLPNGARHMQDIFRSYTSAVATTEEPTALSGTIRGDMWVVNISELRRLLWPLFYRTDQYGGRHTTNPDQAMIEYWFSRVKNQSISFVSYEPPKKVVLSGVRRITQDNGTITVTTDVDFDLQAGDTVNANGNEFVAGDIQYVINPDSSTMTVSDGFVPADDRARQQLISNRVFSETETDVSDGGESYSVSTEEIDQPNRGLIQTSQRKILGADGNEVSEGGRYFKATIKKL
jgi:hypothetical protein